MPSELIIDGAETSFEEEKLRLLEPEPPFYKSPWKAFTLLAVVAVLILSAALTWAFLQGRNLETQKQALVDTIENPRTGYKARLTETQTKVVTVTRDRERVIIAYRTAAETTRRELETTRRQLEAAEYRNRELEARLRVFLRRAPQGVTLEERVRDIDKRVLKELSR